MTSPGWTVSTLTAVVERRRNFCDRGRIQRQMVSQVIVWLFYNALAFVSLVSLHTVEPHFYIPVIYIFL
jgi:hypothetical protein